VAESVGEDRALKRLGLATLADVELVAPNGLQPGPDRVAIEATVRDALSQLLAGGGSPLTVVDDRDQVKGLVTLELLGGLLGNGGLGDHGANEEPAP
jgi:hypothetical protein